MAAFSKFIITNAGQALTAKALAGECPISFTKVCASSTVYTEEQITELVALDEIKQTAFISGITRTNETTVKVDVALTNAELTTGYYMHTIGLYAEGESGEDEILYGVTIETSGGYYIPAYSGTTVSSVCLQLYIGVGNAENVSLEVNPSAYALAKDLQNLAATLEKNYDNSDTVDMKISRIDLTGYAEKSEAISVAGIGKDGKTITFTRADGTTFTVTITGTTYGEATTEVPGLMPASDKKKLGKIPTLYTETFENIANSATPSFSEGIATNCIFYEATASTSKKATYKVDLVTVSESGNLSVTEDSLGASYFVRRNGTGFWVTPIFLGEDEAAPRLSVYRNQGNYGITALGLVVKLNTSVSASKVAALVTQLS